MECAFEEKMSKCVHVNTCHHLGFCRCLSLLLDALLCGAHNEGHVQDLWHLPLSDEHRHMVGLREQRCQPHHIHRLQHGVQEVLPQICAHLLVKEQLKCYCILAGLPPGFASPGGKKDIWKAPLSIHTMSWGPISGAPFLSGPRTTYLFVPRLLAALCVWHEGTASWWVALKATYLSAVLWWWWLFCYFVLYCTVPLLFVQAGDLIFLCHIFL